MYFKMVDTSTATLVSFDILATWVRRGRDRMVVVFTTNCAISAHHHYSCVIEPRSLRGVLDTTFCDKVCQ